MEKAEDGPLFSEWTNMSFYGNAQNVNTRSGLALRQLTVHGAVAESKAYHVLLEKRNTLTNK